MADITDAIGALTRLFTNPQDYVNKPNVVGPEGPIQSFDANGYPSYVDAKTGQVVRTPMANPSGWQRAFNPGLANYIFGQNQAAINAQPEAERHAAGIRTGETSLANLRWPSLPGEEQKFFGTPERMASELGESNPSPSTTEYNANSLEDLIAGNPALRAGTTSSQLGAANLVAQNEMEREQKLKELGAPTNEALASNAGSIYNLMMNRGNADLLPNELALRGINTGNDISLSKAYTNDIPNIIATNAANNRFNRGMAETKANELPTAEDTLENEMMQEYLHSKFAPVMSPYSTIIDHNRAKFGINPIGVSEPALKMRGVEDLGKGLPSQGVSVSKGRTMNISPEIEGPNAQQPRIDPGVQEAIDAAKEAHDKHGVDSEKYHQAVKALEEAHNKVNIENSGIVGVGKDKLKKAIASINRPVQGEGVNLNDIWHQPLGSMLVDRQGNPTLSKENQGPSMADIKQALAGWLFGTDPNALPLPNNQ